jgi:hypothetical protein
MVYYATVYGQADILAILLSRPEVKPCWYGGEIPISLVYLAMKHGHIDAAIVVLRDGRAPLIHDENNYLQIAVEQGFWQLIEHFIKHPAMRPEGIGSYSNLVVRATQNNHWLTIRELLKHAPMTLMGFESPIRISLKAGYLASLRELLKHPQARLDGADLKIAIRRGDLEMAKEMIASPRLSKGPTPGSFLHKCECLELFKEATSTRNTEMVRLFLYRAPKEYIRNHVTEEGFCGASYRTTGEIATLVLDYVEIFEEMAPQVAVASCARGFPNTTKDLMKDPRFKASPEQLEYIHNTLKTLE